MTATEYIHSTQSEAESAVLGVILLDPGSYAEAAKTIKADDFTLSFHQEVFGKIGELYAKNGTYDTVMLLESIIAANTDERINAKEYIMRLIDSVPVLGNLSYYCEFVKKRSIGRKAMEILRNADFKGTSGADIAETVQGAAEKLADLVRDKGRARMQPVKDVLHEIYLDVFEDAEDTSISTGFWCSKKSCKNKIDRHEA